MCGAELNYRATECPHCGEYIDPLKHGRLFRDGKLLVMSRGATFPDRCVVTNQPAEKWLDRKLYWEPPWVKLSAVIPPAYVVFAFMYLEPIAVGFALTSAAASRRYWKMMVRLLLLFGGIAGGFWALLNQRDLPDSVLPWLLLLDFVTIVGSAFWYCRARDVLRVRRTNVDYVWLSGVHPAFLSELPPFPHPYL